jgi:uncharacterized membrane protein
MPRNPAPTRELESPSLPARVSQALRRYFITGLATLFPVVITLWLIVQIVQIADGFLGRALGFEIFGLGLLVTIAVILVVGVLTVHFFGRMLFRAVEIVFVRLPFIRKIYPAVKQLAQFLFSEEQRQASFRRVVLVPYPRAGAYSLAFVTNETKTSATGSPQTLLTVLIPNPPSPFTGPIIFVPQQDVIPLDLSVEDAVKLIVSGGVVTSPLNVAQAKPK